MDLDRKNGTGYSKRLSYVLCDFSEEMLKGARKNIQDALGNEIHSEIIRLVKTDLSRPLPFKKESIMLIRSNELYDDLGGTDLLFVSTDGTIYKAWADIKLKKDAKIFNKQGKQISRKRFYEYYWPIERSLFENGR